MTALRVLAPDGEMIANAVLISHELALTAGSDLPPVVQLVLPNGERVAATATHVGEVPDFAILELRDRLSGMEPVRLGFRAELRGSLRVVGYSSPLAEFSVSGLAIDGGTDLALDELEHFLRPVLQGTGVYNAKGSVVGILNYRDRRPRPPWILLPIDDIARACPPVAAIMEGLARARRPSYAGFLTDQDDGDDLLGRTREIQAMAILLAARETTPPLAVGLFGDWGSGKSFFISKLQREITLLTRASAEAPDATDMCTEVRQITFNAWHYMDANLWASMVSAIFDGLAEPRHGETKENARRRWAQEREHLVAELETSQELLETARAHRRAAEDETSRLQDALEEAVNARSAERDKLVRLKAVATVVRDDPAVRKALADAKAEFRLLPDTDLENVRGDAGSLVRRFVRVWNLLQPAARTKLRLWFWVFGALGVGLCVLVPWLLARFVPDAVQVIASLLAFVAPLTVGVQHVTGVLGRALSGVETAAGVAAEVERRVREERTHEETAILADLERLGAAQANLEHEVLLAQNRRDEAEAALREAAAGTRLTEFIHERSRSADYRSQLGIIAMIRRDFDKLAELLERGRQEATGVPVDRIVLYVDDLDRCPPARVVEVLQAIHLLLALPLFVVVVAVDQRWLLQALEPQFGEAGAVNYLEKIFQVPYRLSTMTQEDFARLVGHHLAVASPSSNGASPDTAYGPVTIETPLSSGRKLSSRLQELPPSYVLRPPGLRLSAEETEFFLELAPLFQTPRAAKRLINLYRFIRASLPANQLTETGEYRCVMYLLAILVGRPDEAEDMFETIRANSLTASDDVLQGMTRAQIEPWMPLVERFSFRF